jgi:hypothetical protein
LTFFSKTGDPLSDTSDPWRLVIPVSGDPWQANSENVLTQREKTGRKKGKRKEKDTSVLKETNFGKEKSEHRQKSNSKEFFL